MVCVIVIDLLLTIAANPATGHTHKKITFDIQPFEQWFNALHGSGTKVEKLRDLGIEDEDAEKTVDFVHGANDDPAACLIVSALLLANNHLPPAEIQSDMKNEFKQGRLKDLYTSLKSGNSLYEQAFVEKIDQFS